MRTRAKKKYVAGDRTRRENVPRHILYYIHKTDRIGYYKTVECYTLRQKPQIAPKTEEICGFDDFT